MSQKFDIGAHGAVWVGGRDLTRYTKNYSNTPTSAMVDSTAQQPVGDAMEFIAGLDGDAISISGMLPVSKILVEAEMQKALGLYRDAEPMLLAPWGGTPGYLALFLETQQTRFGTDSISANITSYNADFIGTGGSKAGTMLQSSQGPASQNRSSLYLLTFDNASTDARWAFKVGSTYSAEFSPSASNGTLTARLEELYGSGNVSITTGSFASNGDDTYSGSKILAFIGALAGKQVPKPTVVEGAVQEWAVEDGDAGTDYSANGGATFALGITAEDFQTNQRAIDDAHSDVVTIGESRPAGLSWNVSGADDPSYLGDYDPFGEDVLENSNGRKLYRQNNDYWIMGPDTNPANVVYQQETGASANPDSSAWVLPNASATSIVLTEGDSVPGIADFISHFAPGVTPDAPSATGTGATATTTHAANAIAVDLTLDDLGNIVVKSAAFNGTWIDLGASSNDGGFAIIEVVYASEDCSATVRIQHADDDGDGAPGSATTLATFEVVTGKGAQFLVIPRGTLCKQWARIAISAGQITGQLASAAAIARNPDI